MNDPSLVFLLVFLPFHQDHLVFLKHLSAILKCSKTRAYLNNFCFSPGLFCLLPVVCPFLASRT